MDGAWWHHSKTLERLENIQSLLVPPYCPERTPMKRRCLQVTQETVRNKVYDSRADLAQAVCSFLGAISTATVAQVSAVYWL
jgi:hypothetical protein